MASPPKSESRPTFLPPPHSPNRRLKSRIRRNGAPRNRRIEQEFDSPQIDFSETNFTQIQAEMMNCEERGRKMNSKVPKGHVWIEGDKKYVSNDLRKFGHVP